MKDAIVFGSIGTLAETSHVQRDAFNQAFAEADLDWHWDERTYRDLLTRSGGRKRIEAYADAVGVSVDAAHLHARKSASFQEALRDVSLPLRPGVEATMRDARERGIPVALATSTSRDNVAGILHATGLGEDAFACVVDRSMIDEPKPAPDAFAKALELLGVGAGDAVAVEDNPDGARAALTAGLACIVTPGAAHQDGAFPEGATVASSLTLAQLHAD